jgi:hypothetical protein
MKSNNFMKQLPLFLVLHGLRQLLRIVILGLLGGIVGELVQEDLLDGILGTRGRLSCALSSRLGGNFCERTNSDAQDR